MSMQPPPPHVQPPHGGHPPPHGNYAPPQGNYPPPQGHYPPQGSDDAVMRAMLPVGRTGLSIAAGYLGLLALFIVPAPFALALGIWAAIDLRSQPEKSGWGRAIFAIVAGTIGSLVLLLMLVSR